MATLKVFSEPSEAAREFAVDFVNLIKNQLGDRAKITVALSGGSTPKILFQILADQFAEEIDWNRIHFFWGDERCVPPDEPDSNYAAAKQLLFDKISIDTSNIHRIQGEANSEAERIRYENEVRDHVPYGAAGWPQFDLITLGMGEDGHTASIFPHQIEFMTSDRICEIATHPSSGQHRITLTGPVLNHAARVWFLITGENKADVLQQVLHPTGNEPRHPAARVVSSELRFYLDEAAAQRLDAGR